MSEVNTPEIDIEKLLAASQDRLVERVAEKMNEQLSALGAGKVQPSTIPATPEHIEASRVNVTCDQKDLRYRALSEAERLVRTYESDQDIATWARALIRHDHASIVAIEAKYPRELHLRADMAEGAAATGGTLVPTPLHNLIIAKRAKIAKMRPRATVVTSAAQTIKFPVENAVAEINWAAEAASPAKSDPTIAAVTLTKKKCGFRTAISTELVEDSAFNLVSFLSDQAGRAFAVGEDVAFFTSDGSSNQPTQGLNQAAITEVNATVGTLTYQDITALMFGLPSEYWQGAVFFASSTVLQYLSELVDGNGRPIFTPAGMAMLPVGDQMPGTVGSLGIFPVVEAPLASDELYFGNPLYYGILDGGPMTAVATTEGGDSWANDQVEWKFRARMDGSVLSTAAWRNLDGITAP
jgi:HK97 family phage major capsid protein